MCAPIPFPTPGIREKLFSPSFLNMLESSSPNASMEAAAFSYARGLNKTPSIS